MDDTNDLIQVGELLPAVTRPRNPNGMVDDLYIECYLDNPSNKTAALRKAVQLSGGIGDTSKTRAASLHKRLSRRIEKGLLKRMMEGGTLGYSVTYSLAADENMNPAIRLKAAENLMNYAGKSRPEPIQEKRVRQDIKDEIKATRKRIKELVGEEI